MSPRIAILDRDLCIRKKCGYQCEKVCPVNRMGEECIVTEEDTQFPRINEFLCIGCGLCVKKCPVDAITIINLAGESGDPVYQYGINAFRLYSLPLPTEGLCGIVGKNGIGKTTALNLLSGKIKPNFGEHTKEFTEDEILERLPIATRRYFESEQETQLEVSYKPQMVDKLRDAFKGTVEKLLKTMDERNAYGDAVEKFGLRKILKRKISQLSGGELQRVSIAAAYLKDADIYYLDEPCNYLDIEERLRTSLILKDFSEGRKMVVVEHDLAILDYMSDYVYIFYGEENGYGVSSGVKSTRAGINEYLAGFLREENIRFRDREITFSEYSERETQTKTRFTYSRMKKEFTGFKFSSDEGDVRTGEIVGIVGKNALGKSIFVKMLAGVENPDEGEPGEFKVSYKPQYIKPQKGTTVFQLFLGSNIDKSVAENAKRELGLMKLMEKDLDQLSGGELQRVSIAQALSQKADIYLFDEPTAFLDVEQRLRFSDLLRRTIAETEKCAFVVDHDVVFVDSIAHRLMVFDGESSVHGHASSPLGKREGMNSFLQMAGITMRRDKDSKRPRINKPESVLDREQREKNEYYYSSKD
ncbi:ribosome biogenesis/translation initiation ATPase RLI [Candidatus Micrarchaeota archaeon]|nr:ribosome biogenesis/translation initiation ATPase RLI [Candidatus Micrarchaeota archaeon]MBD3418405.1 ribosome biogenesis/translation initiation ATPase RLI [Candidatus Micrarchaeota archaeon]